MLQALSIGHRLNVDSAGPGAIHSVFTHAVNLEVGGELWTLLSADRADQPFGIRVAACGFDLSGLVRGAAVDVRSGFVALGSAGERLIVDCRAAPRWIPSRAGRAAAGLVKRLEVVAAASHGAWHLSGSMAATVVRALNHEDALRDALSHVIGHGPGATPAGDDVVIGILAVLTSPLAGCAGTETARALSSAMLPLLPGTSDLSAHLLRQAANGWAGRSVHELILALIEDAPLPALQARVQRVVETGATSGADLCAGVLACARAFPLTHDERAAA